MANLSATKSLRELRAEYEAAESAQAFFAIYPELAARAYSFTWYCARAKQLNVSN